MKIDIDNYFFQVSLKLIIKNENNEILILKMPEDSSMAGYYDFPGGRINSEEVMSPVLDILDREIMEELGSDFKWKLNSDRPVAIARHQYYSKKYNQEMILFWVVYEADYISGEIKQSAEHDGFKWIRLDKNNVAKYFIKGPLEVASQYVKLYK